MTRTSIIGLILIAGLLPAHCMSMALSPLYDMQEKKIKRKRKKPDELEWKVQSIGEDTEIKTPNNEPKLKLLLVRKTPLYFYNLNHTKAATLSKAHEKFLQKIKNIELPCVLNDQEKQLFDSLDYRFLFKLKQTDEGWEIKEDLTYRGRYKMILWP